MRLNPETRIVTVDGADLDLTRSEFDILADLLGSGRRVRAKSDLALMLRGEQYTGVEYVSDSDARAIEVHVANLRRKLGESPANPRWIETVRGVGYRLTALRRRMPRHPLLVVARRAPTSRRCRRTARRLARDAREGLGVIARRVAEPHAHADDGDHSRPADRVPRSSKRPR